MIIYVNGCSHSIGLGKYSWSYVLGKSLCRSIMYISNKGLNEKDSIQYHKEQNTLYNFSDSGKGNDMIFHETLEFLSKCKDNNIKPDYVFIQWSGPSRYSIQEIHGGIRFNNPGDTKLELLNFEPYASRTTLSYIFSLQEILKKQNIEYYFCCYMELDNESKYYSIWNQIDFDKFISFDTKTHPLLEGFRNNMRKYLYVVDGAGHPNYYGHWFLANKFLEKIKIDGCDIGFFGELNNETMNPTMSPKSNKYTDIVSYYGDNMINHKRVKELAIKELLKEGTLEDKNNIRKTLF